MQVLQEAGKAVCLIGNTVRQNLFRTDDPVGKRMRLGNITCDVIGVLSTRGQGGFGDQDDVVVMTFVSNGLVQTRPQDAPAQSA